MNQASVPLRVAGFQAEALDGEVVLLHPAQNTIIHSNQTGALIWNLCDGLRSVDEIIQVLSAAYPESAREIASDVPQTIQALLERGALQIR